MIDGPSDAGQTNLEDVRREFPGGHGSVEVLNRNQLHINPEDAMSALAEPGSEVMRALREVRPAENAEKNEIDSSGDGRRRFQRSTNRGQSAPGIENGPAFVLSGG